MEIRELSSNEMNLIQQVRWIYEQSFPAEERDPFENMLQAILRREQAGPEECEHCHFQVAVEEGQAAGAAFFNYYPKTRMGFIAYLAVHPTRRNGGLGAQLYHHLVECVAGEARTSGSGPAVGVVFEVEPPELGVDAEEQALRRRRIGFYQRNGAVVVPDLALDRAAAGPRAAGSALRNYVSPPGRGAPAAGAERDRSGGGDGAGVQLRAAPHQPLLPAHAGIHSD